MPNLNLTMASTECRRHLHILNVSEGDFSFNMWPVLAEMCSNLIAYSLSRTIAQKVHCVTKEHLLPHVCSDPVAN